MSGPKAYSGSGQALSDVRARLTELTDATKDPVLRLALAGINDLVQTTFALLVTEAVEREQSEPAPAAPAEDAG